MCYIKTSPNYHKKHPGNPSVIFIVLLVTGSREAVLPRAALPGSKLTVEALWLAAAPRGQSTNHMYDDIGGFTWLLRP